MTRRPEAGSPAPWAAGDGGAIPCSTFPFAKPRRIVLIGPMAVGKTTVAAMLADRLGWPWLDTDRMVTESAGQSITEIFAHQGEGAFRAREKAALEKALAQEPVVVATGGGAVLDPDNRAAIQAAGAVVALAAEPDQVAGRLTKAQQARRPLLAGDDPVAAWGRLWRERRPLYRETAHLWLDAGAMDPEQMVELIMQALGFAPMSTEAYRASDEGGTAGEPGAPAQPRCWRRLPVGLPDAPYPVWIGAGLMDEMGSFIAAMPRPPQQVLVVTDSHVEPLFGRRVEASLEAAGVAHTRFVVPAGEEHKNLAQTARVIDAAVAAGLDRHDMMVAVGGGMVGDLTGFAAATYLRGIRWVQVPTTLLAQVDASVGGKTGVNHPQGKNLIGAFHQPVLVLADTGTLATLPPAEWRSGLAEVVKHGFLSGGAYLSFIRTHGDALRSGPTRLPDLLLAALVAGSVAIKAAVVVADEREQNLRALLNLGHTIGHAIEAVAGYGRLRHGEAVAIGMAAAAQMAEHLDLITAPQRREVEENLALLGLPTRLPPVPGKDAVADIMAATATDKKRQRGAMRWVLPIAGEHGLGGAVIRSDVPTHLVSEVLSRLTEPAP
ncbi:MAG TPA: 3-dehydroquinate synthase [Sphingobacteriaceae bacterium]|nr:3-dehydroquinate synthase [Sphingobacteriaceae bacterium]